MPKSKREKVVSLTKVKKRTRAEKQQTVEELQDCAGAHAFTYLFTIENMKNESLKTVRNYWRGNGRFFMGKNKLMIFALGREPNVECKPNMYQLTQRLTGNSSGVFFTNSKPAEVIQYFDEFEEPHYPKSGFIAAYDFALTAGPLEGQPFSLEPQLRALGLPTRLKDGIIILESDVNVCKTGDTLTPEQCKVLKLFGQEMAVFKIRINAVHSGSAVTDLSNPTPQLLASFGSAAAPAAGTNGKAKSKKSAATKTAGSGGSGSGGAAISMSVSGGGGAQSLPQTGSAADFKGAQFMLEDGTEVVDWNEAPATATAAAGKKKTKSKSAAAMEDVPAGDEKTGAAAKSAKQKSSGRAGAAKLKSKSKADELNAPLPFSFDGTGSGSGSGSASAPMSLDLKLGDTKTGAAAPSAATAAGGNSKSRAKTPTKRSSSKGPKKVADGGTGIGKVVKPRKSRVKPMLG